MRARFIKTEQGEFECATFHGQKPPIRPFGDNVLVLTDRMREMSSGGVYLTPNTQDVQNAGAESGVIVAMGDQAFRWNLNRTREYRDDERPKIGDRVCFSRYSGQLIFREGTMFRLMTDNCIGGIEVEMSEIEQAAEEDAA